MEQFTLETAKVHLDNKIETIRNQSIMKKHRTDIELSKEYWRLKELKVQPQIQFCVLKR